MLSIATHFVYSTVYFETVSSAARHLYCIINEIFSKHDNTSSRVLVKPAPFLNLSC